MSFKEIKEQLISIMSTTYKEWLDDRAFKMSAALSFYSLISLVPILTIITALGGLLLGNKAASGELVVSIEQYVGASTASLIEKLILNASVPNSSIFATTISVIVLLWAAASIFVEMKDSLNLIWGVEVKEGKGVKVFFWNRVFSVFVILVIGFIFILSFIAGMLLKIVGQYIENIFEIVHLLYWFDIILSFVLVTLLFAIIIKYLPSVKVEWKYVLIGAFTTSILFNLGNYVVGFYLSNAYYSSVYGAASSLVVFLFWMYYSSLIFFLGAELTQVIRKKYSKKKLKLGKDVRVFKRITEQITEKHQ